MNEILEIDRYGERGWEWTDKIDDGSGDEVVRRRRTDANGEGLWRWMPPPGGISPQWIQLLGHMQYSLTAKTPKAAVNQILNRTTARS